MNSPQAKRRVRACWLGRVCVLIRAAMTTAAAAAKPEYWIEYATGRTYDARWMPTLEAGFSLQTFVADYRKTHGFEDASIVVVDPLTLAPLPARTWLLPGSAVRVLIETPR